MEIFTISFENELDRHESFHVSPPPNYEELTKKSIKINSI
jgi:hypothetical protein